MHRNYAVGGEDDQSRWRSLVPTYVTPKVSHIPLSRILAESIMEAGPCVHGFHELPAVCYFGNGDELVLVMAG